VVIITYGRDALHRHVSDTVGSTVTDRFFSSDWQLLETKVGSNTVTRNVWSPVYVDGLVLRDRDTDANGTFDERLYSLQDANWNTTGLVNAGGTVQERYTYTPFGQVTFRDGSGSTLSNSAKDWVFLHQGGEKIAAGQVVE
jgi:YD repeat-containing protein